MNTQTSKSIRFHNTGGPEVLVMEEVTLPDVGPGEAQIKNHAIGVNFVDTYYRSGLYPTTLPAGMGFEGAGVIEKVGSNVSHIKVGDRVAYAQGPIGAYAQRRVMPAWQMVKIPDSVSFNTAASIMLKGLTVYYLFHDTYQLKKGETILFHAAAGGVGLIACQWARHLGVNLIGTVSSKEKADIAIKNGAFKTINYTTEDIIQKVLEFNNGKKLPVVYDGVGKSTWEASLHCLQPRGLMVSYGNASGPVTGVDLGILSKLGSLYVTRPSLSAYVSTPESLNKAANELFKLVADGILRVEEDQIFPLEKAKEAHMTLLDRKRIGGIILVP